MQILQSSSGRAGQDAKRTGEAISGQVENAAASIQFPEIPGGSKESDSQESGSSGGSSSSGGGSSSGGSNPGLLPNPNKPVTY